MIFRMKSFCSTLGTHFHTKTIIKRMKFSSGILACMNFYVKFFYAIFRMNLFLLTFSCMDFIRRIFCIYFLVWNLFCMKILVWKVLYEDSCWKFLVWKFLYENSCMKFAWMNFLVWNVFCMKSHSLIFLEQIFSYEFFHTKSPRMPSNYSGVHCSFYLLPHIFTSIPCAPGWNELMKDHSVKYM